MFFSDEDSFAPNEGENMRFYRAGIVVFALAFAVSLVQTNAHAELKDYFNLGGIKRPTKPTCPDGCKGDKGDTGAKGDKGDPGEMGATGPMGPASCSGEGCLVSKVYDNTVDVILDYCKKIGDTYHCASSSSTPPSAFTSYSCAAGDVNLGMGYYVESGGVHDPVRVSYYPYPSGSNCGWSIPAGAQCSPPESPYSVVKVPSDPYGTVSIKPGYTAVTFKAVSVCYNLH